MTAGYHMGDLRLDDPMAVDWSEGLAIFRCVCSRMKMSAVSSPPHELTTCSLGIVTVTGSIGGSQHDPTFTAPCHYSITGGRVTLHDDHGCGIRDDVPIA